MFVATIVPAVSAARRPVTDVLRDVPRDRVSWLNRRVGGLPRRLSFLGAQEAASQPVRSGLAALAVVVALVGTIVSLGFIDGIGIVSDDPARQGDPWRVAVIVGDTPTDEVEAALAGVPGVARWFADLEQRSTFRDGAFLSVATAGDPDAADYRIARGRSMRDGGEAIAGYGFLERFGVDVGDRVRFRAGTTPLEVTIVGEYRDTEDSGEVLRYRFESLAAAEPGVEPSVFRVQPSAGVEPAVVARALQERLGPAVRAEILDTGEADIEPFMVVLRLIALVLLVMAGANLLSTLLTASRESAARIGIEVAVGFTPGQVRAQGAVAGAVIGVAAAVVGIPLGLVVFRGLADVVSRAIGVGPGWMPLPGGAPLVVLGLAAVAVSASLGATAVGRVVRRPAADLVRGE